MPLIPTTQFKLSMQPLPYLIHTAGIDQVVDIHVANNSDRGRDIVEEEKVQIYLLPSSPSPDPLELNIPTTESQERFRNYILLGYLQVLNNEQHITRNVYLRNGDRLFANCSHNRITVTIMGQTI